MAISATERIVNLALFLAAAAGPVSATEIAAGVAGYPAGQKPDAFLRMFERDKDELRGAGLVIAIDRTGDAERYRFDATETYAGDVELTPVEAVELRAAAAAMLADPSFPYTDDLRTAIAKVVAGAGARVGSSSAILPSASADETPAAQAESVAALTRAVEARKRVVFAYTGAGGKSSQREVEPWGLFARDGRWYVVAWDPQADAERVFAVARMRGIAVNAGRPKTPDFERPEGFDVARWMVMPFQFGPERHAATLRLRGQAARRATAITAGQGELAPDGSGFLWHIRVADERLLARWAMENGPGIDVVEPASLRDELERGLRKVVELHG